MSSGQVEQCATFERERRIEKTGKFRSVRACHTAAALWRAPVYTAASAAVTKEKGGDAEKISPSID